MTIRTESKADYATLYDLVKTAFATAKVSDGDEQDFMERLRASAGYIPALALVAEEDGKLAGHIMLTGTAVTDAAGKDHPVLLLAPLSVVLEHRDRGVGSALVREALSRAQALGWGAVFLAGDRNYYGRFGFVPASRFGIACDMEVPPELLDNIMARELTPGALEGVTGTVAFHT